MTQLKWFCVENLIYKMQLIFRDIHTPNRRMDPAVVVLLSCYFGVLLQSSFTLAQTNQPDTLAYFNGTAQATVNSQLNFNGDIVFSFRTCNGGELLSQTGAGGDSVNFQVDPSSGSFRVQWTVSGTSGTVALGGDYDVNTWEQVTISVSLGQLQLTVGSNSTVLDNALLSIDLSGGALLIGNMFDGCIEEVSGLNMTSASQFTNVQWGECPLDSQQGCGAPIIDPCYSIPCQHGGICTNLGDSYTCQCTARYNGSHCEIDTGLLCNKTKYIKDCQNGGFCTEDSTGNYTFCQCPPEWEGELCERPANYCASNPCQNGGICRVNNGNNGYICNCQEGWSGSECEINIDECGSYPCFNNGVCMDGVNEYVCNCTDTGYEGVRCEANLDECTRDNPCENGATCTDQTGSYHCACVDGYEGENCEVDVNECSSDPCQNGATCNDLINDYECNCPAEWMGKNCEEIYDPCIDLDPCENNSNCTSTPPSPDYTCVCVPGFDGDNCENNIDDCLGVICPEVGQICFDLIEGFECRCPVGYEGDRCETDTDECASDPCQNGAECIDNIGSYTCNCTYGFDGVNCENRIDFCNPIPCQNDGICVEKDLLTPPGYQCYCIPAYTGYNCEKTIDECASNPCENGATCNDGVLGYTCECAPGFRGTHCGIDIDECASSPCLNGATCDDQINGYVCQCQPGFNGTSCEMEIDECLSSPCLNEGVCVDLINGYQCNCTDTGFTGPSCEVNIDDCDPFPCKNGATCNDLIKDYDCACFDGYNGKNCENDIDECASVPCQNEGLCLQMSDESNYQDGFEHRDRFPDEFSHANASGYVCVCEPGFKGVECEINIDECESDPCQNGATCNDLVNSYECECAPGWEGPNCETEIDECASTPCQNGGTCTDLVAMYTCECTSEYGGLNCEVLLTACIDNPSECLNGATCIPFYDHENDRHSLTCECMSGYTGERCEVSTSASFRDGMHMVDSSTNNKATFAYSLSFATTLPSGLLLYSGDNIDYILLEMYEGSLYFTYSGFSFEALKINQLGSMLADGEWHSVKLTITDTDITLSVTGTSDTNELTSRCSGGTCLETIQRNGNTVTLDSLYIGGLDSSHSDKISLTKSGLSYTGCMQDITNDGTPVLPSGVSGKAEDITAAGDAEGGCSRKEQCTPDPCSGNGECTDRWWEYACECNLRWTGPNCSYSFVPGTFSFEETTSYAQFMADAPLTLDENIIRLIFRTREKNGVIFYTAAADDSYITLELMDGKLAARADFTAGMTEIVVGEDFANARYHHVTLERVGDMLSLQVNKMEAVMEPFSNATLPDFSDFYVGGLEGSLTPIPNSITSDVAFKGCLRDVKYNKYSLEFFPLDIPGFIIDSFPMTVNESVLEGCQSDDTCRTTPCENSGTCEVTWNDFVCDCPNGFGGKNCSELTICAFDPCPFSVQCWDRDDGGYDCVTEATFNGEGSLIRYHNSINDSRPLDTITLQLRTRESDGLILHSNNQPLGFFFTLELFQGKPQFRFNLGTENTLMMDYAINDGEWHDIEIMVESDKTTGIVDSTYNVEISTDMQASLESTITADGSSDVYLANTDFTNDKFFNNYNVFDGCMDEIRIGEILLPFFTESIYNSTSMENFYATITEVSINCTGEPVCDSNPCQNEATCKDLWNEFECQCAPGFNGTLCEINIDECLSDPCLMGSTCEDGINNFTCRCMPGYEGRLCDIDIDECASDPCLNNAIECIDLINGFECNCNANYTGRRCEFLVSETCDDEPCQNGATCHSLNDTLPGENAYRCECVPGYEGENCAYPIDYCANHTTCQNGATCNSSLELLDYICHCMPGYEGRFCEVDINECDGVDCQNGGTCEDLINDYECNCAPGYEGDHCEQEIDECASNPCKNDATCEDQLNGFQCHCQYGYEGALCQFDINECVSNPCQNSARCENTIGDFTCHCTPDIYGKLCDVTPCAPSPCLNGASCNTQPPGEYVCNCTLGYEGQVCAKASCAKVECQNEATCSEAADKSSWECQCPRFYQGDLCQWAGPCLLDPCENGGTCEQTLVGESAFEYQCHCRIGFNGTDCENEIDWCTSNPCQYGSTCVSDRFGLNCTCAPGYDGDFCQIKLPDCASGLCQNNATCVDSDFSFECQCVPGFDGTHCEININECASEPCLNNGLCRDLINEYICDCAGTGYEGTTCESDIDECLTEPCENGASCENLDGSFKCECLEPFIGDFCQVKDPCVENPCKNNGVCTPVFANETLAWPSCKCSDGYKGEKCGQGGTAPINWLVIGIIIGVVVALILIIVIIAFIIVVKNKRATQGTYSPSRQEITGSRVEMDNVLKLPPEERLI